MLIALFSPCQKLKSCGFRAVRETPVLFSHPSKPIGACYNNPEEYKCVVLAGVTFLLQACEHLLKRRGGNESSIYAVNNTCFISTVKVGVKHFAVTQEAE